MDAYGIHDVCPSCNFDMHDCTIGPDNMVTCNVCGKVFDFTDGCFPMPVCRDCVFHMISLNESTGTTIHGCIFRKAR